ncbi:TetR/AcrR family transcriptional regulator [uncultured Aquitalea sp.]|uniref:TetR/AcrR family transcriptional regulator n=1 Tax=uncultured Aquitalea sp. TaxID=540272 RepID=UPI0025CBB737|nr:TetR/AcrR family transcriptional regulator [uncultured Aquitalea sp.]
MRYQPEHKAAIRQRMLDMAGLRFRAEGLDSVGIANLMADLGLTHGGFYCHFRDKESLIAEACRQAMQEQAEQWRQLAATAEPGYRCQAIAEAYLSESHRDFPDTGCVAAALAGELSRHSPQARHAFTDGLGRWLDLLESCAEADAGNGASQPPPAAQLALMVGAMVLSRAVNDDALSHRLLREAMAWLEEEKPAGARLSEPSRPSASG